VREIEGRLSAGGPAGRRFARRPRGRCVRPSRYCRGAVVGPAVQVWRPPARSMSRQVKVCGNETCRGRRGGT